jgi:integrating conjugative element protein (TIGR03749 family)
MGTAQSEEVIEWRNWPISIVLNVGEERVLAFPDHVQVGVPPTLGPATFRTQSTGGTVLWLAHQPFSTQRLQVRLIESGHVMLFDVTAVSTPVTDPGDAIRVVFPESGDGQARVASNTDQTISPVTLTRFAAQQLYAPERVLRKLPGVRRVPMGVHESIALYRDERILAKPLASWQGRGLYVTAVELANTGSTRLYLDPRHLRGRFVTATFQHNSLGPKRSRSDTTTAYLVTDTPFSNASVPDAASSDHGY